MRGVHKNVSKVIIHHPTQVNSSSILWQICKRALHTLSCVQHGWYGGSPRTPASHCTVGPQEREQVIIHHPTQMSYNFVDTG
jgi:hypothetical protein